MGKFIDLHQVEIAAELKEKVASLKPEKSHLVETLDIQYTKIYRDCVEAKMPVTEKVLQPFGILHGGALVALAESLASFAGWLNIDETRQRVVGAEINANHIRSSKDGFVLGRAVPINLGRRLQIWEVKIFNQIDQLVSISRCTLVVVGSETDRFQRKNIKEPTLV